MCVPVDNSADLQQTMILFIVRNICTESVNPDSTCLTLIKLLELKELQNFKLVYISAHCYLLIKFAYARIFLQLFKVLTHYFNKNAEDELSIKISLTKLLFCKLLLFVMT